MERISSTIFFSINFGLFINVILFYLFSFLKIPLNSLLFIYPGLTILLILLSCKKIVKHIKEITLDKNEYVLFFLIIISFILLMLKKGEIPIDINYLVPVSRSLGEGILINKQFVFFTELYDPRFSFNPFCYIILLMKIFSKYSLIYIWRNIPFIWVFSSLISMYSFGELFFNNKKAGIFIVIIFFLHYGGFLFELIGFTAFNKPLPLHLYVYVPLFWLSIIRMFKENKKIFFISLFISLCNLISYNPFYFILALLSVFLFYLYEISKDSRKAFKQISYTALVFLMSIPFLSIKIMIFSGSNPAFFDISVANTYYSFRNVILFINQNAYILKPFFLFRIDYSLQSLEQNLFPITSIAATILMPILIILKKWKYPEIRFLILSVVGIILVAENPIIFPILTFFISLIYSQAIGIIIPSFIIIGFCATVFYEYLETKSRYIKQIALFLLILVLVVFFRSNIKKNYLSIKEDCLNREILYKIPSPIEYVISSGFERKMFLSDPKMSDFISSFTNNFVFHVNATDSNPNDLFALEREKQYERLLIEKDIDVIRYFFLVNKIDYFVTAKSISSEKEKNLLNLQNAYFFKTTCNTIPLYLKIKDDKSFSLEWEDDEFVILKFKDK
ncbi:MAG: hypothetical protein PHV06_02125 [bacterium]|nr:hypothetical protein [bacterium]